MAGSEVERDSHKGAVAFRLPSRYIPAAAIVIAVSSIFASVACCYYFEQDIGGIYWPYISDTAKEQPQAGLYSYGMSLVSALIVVTVFIHHGKVKLRLYALRDGHRDVAGQRRARLARAAGCFAAPNLGLLACYDTKRAPELHLLFVLLFFVPTLVYVICTVSVYRMLVSRQEERTRLGKPRLQRDAYVSLHTSLRWKQRIAWAFAFFFTLYLPVGLSLVSDFYDYRKDVAVHTFRAACQHCAVLSLVLFFGTMWWDFGDLVLRILQTVE
eukprot:TRINITY_DN70058_c0_g1_i1.p1 TRINITY_DN70058_c0_g1~~TRINITY_DN70058_c0_g1_i1.p1  ORF type:complete len:293 (+),score=110.62 TRINITY_DN70058_c0_g1_i1:70-879(+)